MLIILAWPALAAGDDDGIEISGAIAQDALIGQLQSRNLAPPSNMDLTLSDYVYNNAGQARFHASVGVWLGPEGHMVPSPEWQGLHKTYCKYRARSPREATRLLGFKMIRVTEKAHGKDRSQYFVDAFVMNRETGKVQKQHRGESTFTQADNSKFGVGNNPDAEGLAPAMDAAWDGLAPKVGSPTSPCGDIRVKHVSGDVVGKDVTFRAGWNGFANPGLTYSWDFGDGSTSADGDQNASHVYAKEGTYTVTVRVASNGDDKKTKPGTGSVSVVIKKKKKDESGAAIQPRTGTWAIKLTTLDMHGCSARLAGAVKKATANLQGKNNKKKLEFAKPFHPKPLMQENPKSLHWQQTGVNTWKTTIAGKSSKAMSMKVVLQAQVISSTRINEIGTHYIDISPTLAKLMGGSAHCRAIGHYELTWLR